MNNVIHDQTAQVSAKTFDSIGWGLFFIWVGIAFLASVGWFIPTVLIVVGVAILVSTWKRRSGG